MTPRLAPMLFCLIAAAPASAQNWPSKPVQIVVPFAAGGAVDLVGRVFSQALQDAMKTPFVIVNRPGAGGNIGTDVVAKAAPDGHTILLTTNGQSISPAIFKSLAWDPFRDFTPVTQLFSTSIVIVTSPKSRLTTLQDVIAAAKARPGDLNYGGTGVGNAFHLTMELLKGRAGFDMRMVPYKSDGEIINALNTGDIEIAMLSIATARPQVENGDLRGIAITSPRRSKALPGVPTVAEQGIPGFSAEGYIGFFAPAKTPREIVERLWREAKAAMDQASLQARLEAFAVESVASSPDEFAAFYRADVERFKTIVRDANIPLQE